MFARVVLLLKPRVQCVVPEKYIRGLDDYEADLKTWGVDKTHDHLIYWKNIIGGLPDAEINPPDFRVDKSNVFPPTTDSACYMGRVKGFYSKCFFL